MSQSREASDLIQYQQYLAEVQSGRGLLQLTAVRDTLARNPALRDRWHAATFTPLMIFGQVFDPIVRTVAYHFHVHGQRYGTVECMTQEALKYYLAKKPEGQPVTLKDGSPGLQLPNGSLYTTQGKIVTYWL